MPRKGENFTSITVSNSTYEELFRRKANEDESMESVLKRLIVRDMSGYKPDIDIQSKKDLLKRIKRSFDQYDKVTIDINNIFSKLTKEITEAIK